MKVVWGLGRKKTRWELAAWLGVLGSKSIAGQNKRVVNTQLPKRSSLRGGEKFVQGGRISLTYRKRREELIALARGGESAAPRQENG